MTPVWLEKDKDGIYDEIDVYLPDGRVITVFGDGLVEFFVSESDDVAAMSVKFNAQA